MKMWRAVYDRWWVPEVRKPLLASFCSYGSCSWDRVFWSFSASTLKFCLHFDPWLTNNLSLAFHTQPFPLRLEPLQLSHRGRVEHQMWSLDMRPRQWVNDTGECVLCTSWFMSIYVHVHVKIVCSICKFPLVRTPSVISFVCSCYVILNSCPL